MRASFVRSDAVPGSCPGGDSKNAAWATACSSLTPSASLVSAVMYSRSCAGDSVDSVLRGSSLSR